MASLLSAMNNEDWNVPSPTRLEILGQLKTLIQEILGMDKVLPSFWALCQAADVLKLDELIQDVREAPSDRVAKKLLKICLNACDTVIKTCRFCKLGHPHILLKLTFNRAAKSQGR